MLMAPIKSTGANQEHEQVPPSTDLTGLQALLKKLEWGSTPGGEPSSVMYAAVSRKQAWRNSHSHTSASAIELCCCLTVSGVCCCCSVLFTAMTLAVIALYCALLHQYSCLRSSPAFAAFLVLLTVTALCCTPLRGIALALAHCVH